MLAPGKIARITVYNAGPGKIASSGLFQGIFGTRISMHFTFFSFFFFFLFVSAISDKHILKVVTENVDTIIFEVDNKEQLYSKGRKKTSVH